MTRLARMTAGLSATIGLLAAPAVASAATLIAQWKMDEKSGTTMVDSVSHLNGSLSNVGLGTGAFVGQYLFNGASSIATVMGDDRLNPDPASGPLTPKFTVTAIVTPTAVPNSTVGDFDIVRKGLSSTTGGYWKMEIYPNSAHNQGRAMCQMKGSLATTGTFVAGPNLVNSGQHTIQCIKEATRVTVVVDGTAYQKNVSVGRINSTARVTIGAKLGGGDWFAGRMNEINITKG
jgi:hypothetical protein